MAVLIVGGDHINTYKEYLQTQGLGPVLHWNGRRNSDCHRQIPASTRLVVILVDQVNHMLAIKLRRIAGDLELPVVFTRRSIGQLDQAINHFKHSADACRLQ